MLCDRCQIRDATVHFTVCTGSPEDGPKLNDDGPKDTDLCQQCFEVSDLKVAIDLPADFQVSHLAGCRYCDGESASGGLDPLALLGGIRKMRYICMPCAKEYYICMPCAKEYYGFLGVKLPGFGDGNRTKEQMDLLVANLKACDFPAVILELDDHMKEWVAKRKSQ